MHFFLIFVCTYWQYFYISDSFNNNIESIDKFHKITNKFDFFVNCRQYRRRRPFWFEGFSSKIKANQRIYCEYRPFGWHRFCWVSLFAFNMFFKLYLLRACMEIRKCNKNIKDSPEYSGIKTYIIPNTYSNLTLSLDSTYWFLIGARFWWWTIFGPLYYG